MNGAVKVITLSIEDIEEMLEKASKKGAKEALHEFEQAIFEQYFNYDQGAQYLDVKVVTVKKYMREDNLPYYKKVGRVFFKKSEVSDWLESGRVKTDKELQSESEKLISSKSAA